MEKNRTFFLKNGKERNVTKGKERGAQPCKNSCSFTNDIKIIPLSEYLSPRAVKVDLVLSHSWQYQHNYTPNCSVYTQSSPSPLLALPSLPFTTPLTSTLCPLHSRQKSVKHLFSHIIYIDKVLSIWRLDVDSQRCWNVEKRSKNQSIDDGTLKNLCVPSCNMYCTKLVVPKTQSNAGKTANQKFPHTEISCNFQI